jgi:hypothetical protein
MNGSKFGQNKIFGQVVVNDVNVEGTLEKNLEKFKNREK